MDLEAKNGEFGIRVTADDLTDLSLQQAAREIREVAETRGLDIPALAGSVTVGETAGTETIPEKPDRSEIKTGIVDQLTAANAAYTTILDTLNAAREEKDRIEVADAETVEREYTEWFTDEKLEYVASAMEADPELRFTLIATPNVLATKDEVIGLAREFAKIQPYVAYVHNSAYENYTPEQLSGTDPESGNSVVFSLIPNKLSPDLEGTVAHQRKTLAKMQANNPYLRVPSVLEDVVHWQTLHAQDRILNWGNVFDYTYVRHFDLPEQSVLGVGWVPRSYIDADGVPGLFGSRVIDSGFGRIALS